MKSQNVSHLRLSKIIMYYYYNISLSVEVISSFTFNIKCAEMPLSVDFLKLFLASFVLSKCLFQLYAIQILILME